MRSSSCRPASCCSRTSPTAARRRFSSRSRSTAWLFWSLLASSATVPSRRRIDRLGLFRRAGRLAASVDIPDPREESHDGDEDDDERGEETAPAVVALLELAQSGLVNRLCYRKPRRGVL